ncbi:MAG: hypothetical protein V3W19_04290 [Desulfatiglandales bacterium]
MEKWVLEKWDNGLLEKFLLTWELKKVRKRATSFLKSTFHYSMCGARNPSLTKVLDSR